MTTCTFTALLDVGKKFRLIVIFFSYGTLTGFPTHLGLPQSQALDSWSVSPPWFDTCLTTQPGRNNVFYSRENISSLINYFYNLRISDCAPIAQIYHYWKSFESSSLTSSIVKIFLILIGQILNDFLRIITIPYLSSKIHVYSRPLHSCICEILNRIS